VREEVRKERENCEGGSRKGGREEEEEKEKFSMDLFLFND